MPEDNACRDGDVQRMLGPVLRNLEHSVGGVHHFLADPVDLVSEHKGVFTSGFRDELVKHD